jgi:hypothetical protein
VKHVARMVGMRNSHKILVGKLKRKRPPVTPRHRYVCNIRMDFREVGSEDVDCINVTHDSEKQCQALVNNLMNCRVS